MDDAVLSVGGHLLLRRGVERMSVLSVARWSEYTKYAQEGASLDRLSVSALRLAETQRAAELVGFEHEMMDELDFPVRVRAEQPTEAQGPNLVPLLAAAKRFGPSAAELADLSARLFARVLALAPDELWIPLGVGENPDHVRTALACLTMLHTEARFFDDRRVSLYEDLSPLPAFVGHAERIVAVHARTGVLRRIEEDISSVVSDKVRAVALYESQFDMAASSRPMSNLSALISASTDGPTKTVEVRYEIAQRPHVPAFSEIAFRPLALIAAKLALAPWIRLRRRVTHIAVFNAGVFGNLARGREVLSRAFPNAELELFAEEAVLRATLERRTANDTLVLIIGARASLRDADLLPQSAVISPSFGDAIMALQELVSE